MQLRKSPKIGIKLAKTRSGAWSGDTPKLAIFDHFLGLFWAPPGEGYLAVFALRATRFGQYPSKMGSQMGQIWVPQNGPFWGYPQIWGSGQIPGSGTLKIALF